MYVPFSVHLFEAGSIHSQAVVVCFRCTIQDQAVVTVLLFLVSGTFNAKGQEKLRAVKT